MTNTIMLCWGNLVHLICIHDLRCGYLILISKPARYRCVSHCWEIYGIVPKMLENTYSIWVVTACVIITTPRWDESILGGISFCLGARTYLLHVSCISSSGCKFQRERIEWYRKLIGMRHQWLCSRIQEMDKMSGWVDLAGNQIACELSVSCSEDL